MSELDPDLDARWPGFERRHPRLLDRHYLALAGLARALEEAIPRELAGRSGLKVLDLGCGDKPYYPWLAPYCDEYVGIDRYPGPHVDHVCPAERLDVVADESMDVVLCTQVLEHVLDPAAVVREIRRVLRPAGLCLASTHGVFVYHGQPRDYWRWTHEGLERLFSEAGGFGRLEVLPTDGIASAIAGLIDFYVCSLAERYWFLRWLRLTLHPALGASRRLDRYLAWSFESNPLTINYLVLASR